MNDTKTNATTDDDRKNPQRVVSLLGAATETIYRLGLGDRLVGRSHECDYPKACLSLPCISRPRLDVDACSADIDSAVRGHSAAGEPVYKLDDAVIVTLAPDLLIAQDHCRVCAVTPKDVANSVGCSNIPQLVVKPSTLVECLDDITKVASAMGVYERGVALRATLEERIDRVHQLVVANNNNNGNNNKPRVALLEWCDPIMGCGYWLPDLVEKAGGIPLHCPPSGGATPTISYDMLVRSKPDVLVFALCGFGLVRAASEIMASWGTQKIDRLQRMCPVFVVDGNYLINRSGPRLVESCEALAEVIHPHLLGHFGHYGTDMCATMDKAVAMVHAGETTGSNKIRPPPMNVDPTTATATTTGTTSTLSQQEELALPLPFVVLSSPAETVSAQLKCLETGNMLQAFAMNSTANQDRWCSPDRFEGVLRGHDDFCRLLLKDSAALVGAVEEKGGIATVRVSLPKQDGRKTVELLWTMVTQIVLTEDGGTASNNNLVWRTEKVGMAH